MFIGKPRRPEALAIVAAVVAVAVIVWILWSRSRTRQSTYPDDATSPFRGMVLVPDGPYDQGTTQAEAERLARDLAIDAGHEERFWSLRRNELVVSERRRRPVPAFYIDRHECTNLQYHQFMKATRARVPVYPTDHPNRWRGGRLPGSTQLFFTEDVRDWDELIRRLCSGSAPGLAQTTPIGRVWALLPQPLRERLADREAAGGKPVQPALTREILAALNRVLNMETLYDPACFADLAAPEAAALIDRGIDRIGPLDLQRLNRLLLDHALGDTVHGGQPPSAQYLPVVGITWSQAKRCAEWMGKRLPTECEWEKAARGPASPDGEVRRWPWGNTFGSAEVANCNWAPYWASPHNQEGRPCALAPVGSFPRGASVYGVEDLAGNALEWIADSWAPHPEAPGDVRESIEPPASPNLAVIKGGAYGEQFPDNLRIAFRFGMHKGENSDAVGFRAARSPQVGLDDLRRVAGDRFPELAAPDRLDWQHGIAGAEKVRYLDTEFPIIQQRRLIAVASITALPWNAAEGLQALREPTVLGLLHTDVAFTTPDLPAGDYLITIAPPGEQRPAGPKEADVVLVGPGKGERRTVSGCRVHVAREAGRTRLSFHSQGTGGLGVNVHVAVPGRDPEQPGLALDLALSGPVDEDLRGWYQPE